MAGVACYNDCDPFFPLEFTRMTVLLSDGLVAFVKRACPTCVMAERAMREIAAKVPGFQVVSQDDPHFPAGVARIVDDRELEHSWRNNIEATPTLIRYEGGREVERIASWDREGWRRLTGIADLGADLPVFRPG
jgi:glutaredoxin